jgi:hypothetical protein
MAAQAITKFTGAPGTILLMYLSAKAIGFKREAGERRSRGAGEMIGFMQVREAAKPIRSPAGLAMRIFMAVRAIIY